MKLALCDSNSHMERGCGPFVNPIPLKPMVHTNIFHRVLNCTPRSQGLPPPSTPLWYDPPVYAHYKFQDSLLINTFIHIRTGTYICTCTYVRHVCMYVCACVCVCMLACLHVCVCMYTWMYVHIYVRTYVCAYIIMYVHTYVHFSYCYCRFNQLPNRMIVFCLFCSGI